MGEEEEEEEEENAQARRDDTNVYGFSLGRNGLPLIAGMLQEGGPLTSGEGRKEARKEPIATRN